MSSKLEQDDEEFIYDALDKGAENIVELWKLILSLEKRVQILEAKNKSKK